MWINKGVHYGWINFSIGSCGYLTIFMNLHFEMGFNQAYSKNFFYTVVAFIILKNYLCGFADFEVTLKLWMY